LLELLAELEGELLADEKQFSQFTFRLIAPAQLLGADVELRSQVLHVRRETIALPLHGLEQGGIKGG
jgi:hypothetical protein